MIENRLQVNSYLRQHICLCVVLFILASIKCNAQLSDLARIEYTNLPSTSSDFEFNRVRVLLNYPLKLKKEGAYLFLGVDYSNINLFFEENIPFDKDELDGFQLFDDRNTLTFKTGVKIII